MSLLNRILTKNYTKVPLFRVDFNYKKFEKYGKQGSCVCVLHPVFKRDKHIEETLNHLVDYIRDRYDMKKVL